MGVSLICFLVQFINRMFAQDTNCLALIALIGIVSVELLARYILSFN